MNSPAMDDIVPVPSSNLIRPDARDDLPAPHAVGGNDVEFGRRLPENNAGRAIEKSGYDRDGQSTTLLLSRAQPPELEATPCNQRQLLDVPAQHTTPDLPPFA